jgi:site-specific recombinase XerC
MRSQLKQVAILLGKHDIDEVTWHDLEYQQLIYVRTQLLEAGKSISTVNTTLAAIRGVLQTAFKMSLITADHLARISQIENVRGNVKNSGIALSLADSRRLIKKVSKDTSVKGIRDIAILMLMLTSGLRRSEVVCLAHGSFDFDGYRVNILSKGRKVRHHDISGITLKALKKWAALSEFTDANAPFFTQVRGSKELSAHAIYRIVKHRGKSIGIDNLRPHDLRRTFVSLMLEQGADLSTVSKAVGHASVATTTRYDKRSGNAQISAMRKLTDNLGRRL